MDTLPSFPLLLPCSAFYADPDCMTCHYRLNNNINLTFSTCYEISKFCGLSNRGLASDVLLDQEDDSLKGVGSFRHEGNVTDNGGSPRVFRAWPLVWP
jgi:hypothetical protein